MISGGGSQKKKIDNYTVYLDRKLGEGSFGKVYIGQQDKTNQKVAVKMLDKKLIDRDEYIKSALLAEISILKTLKSPNIVGFYDVMESANYYYIVQEFCDGGDLRALIKKRAPIPEAEAIDILRQVCNGFVELLKEGIIHRDLKPENILISKGVMKICDFGFSKKSNSKRMKHKTVVGTPLYMSIEILKGQQYTSKCDIWALGFIFYELLHSITPWDADSEYQLIENITNQPLKFPKPLSAEVKDFLTRCLRPLEKDRISWDQLLRHGIFKGYFIAYSQKQSSFENKLKNLMGQIRFQITSQNIDLERLFQRHGYNKQTELRFEHFEQFLKTIDASLTSEEQRYMFQQLDENDSNSISLGELEKAMEKHNIPLRSSYRPQRKDSMNSQGEVPEPTANVKRNTESKVISAFTKLSQKMHKNGIELKQVFEAYDINRDGDITIKQFKRIMLKLDETFTDDEIQMAFGFVDVDNNKSIVYLEFLTYFCKVTGDPLNDFMSMRESGKVK